MASGRNSTDNDRFSNVGRPVWVEAAPWLFWGLVFVSIGLASSRDQLFGVVSYELGFVTAIALGLAGLHLGPLTLARWRRAHPGKAPKGLRQGMTLLAGLYWAAFWPLLAMAATTANIVWAVGRWQCNQIQGLWFFLLLAGVTSLLAPALGLAWAFVFRRQWSATVAGFAFLLFVWGWGLVRFYGNPPVAIYDPIVGYFSGNLYDELLLLDRSLIWARIYHLVSALWLFGLAAGLGPNSPIRPLLSITEKRRFAAALALMTMVFLSLTTVRTKLGFDLDKPAIRSHLAGFGSSPHFELIYDASSVDSTLARRILLDAEFRYDQLSDFFGAKPAGKITIFLFGSSLQKKKLLGAHRVEMAKPWRKEIYITNMGFPHPVIKHELAHVFAGAFGDPVFAVSFRWTWWKGIVPIPNFNPGLIEGAAVAADWPPSTLSPDEKAKAIFSLGYELPLSQVMGYSFFANAAVRSYSVAGSFCRFLVTKYGAKRFRMVYRSGGDFEKAYGSSLARLERKWRSYLNGIELPKEKLALAKRMLQRRSIFSSPCVHKVALLEQRAAGLPPDKALVLHRQICLLDPADPSHLWDLLTDMMARDDMPEAMGVGLAILRHPLTTRPSKARLFILLGDMLWKTGRLETAKAFYERARRFESSPAQIRAITVRLSALADPLVRSAVRHLLLEADPKAPSEFALLLRRRPGWAMGSYLLGSWFLYKGKPTQAAFALRRALKGSLPTGPLRWEAALRLGRARFFQGRYQAAADLFERLARSPVPSWIARLATDWAQRSSWMRRKGRKLEVEISSP